MPLDLPLDAQRPQTAPALPGRLRPAPRLGQLCLATGLLVALTAHAQTPPDTSAPRQPRWELGVAALGVSQAAYPGSDQQVQRVLPLPMVLYRGERLRIDRQSVGVQAIRSNDFELDVGLGASLGSSSKDISARQGMASLGTLVELGPRARWYLGSQPGWAGSRWRFDLPVRGVFSLSEHFANRGVAVEPEVSLDGRVEGWYLKTSLAALWGDRRLNGTFYDVAASEALVNRAAYTARSGLMAWRLSATAARSLTPDWRVFTSVRLDSLSGAANVDSPLVRQRSNASMVVGVTYTWMRSEDTAAP